MKSPKNVLQAIANYRITTEPPLYKPFLRLVINFTCFVIMIWGIFRILLNSSDSYTIANGVSVALIGLAAICFSLTQSIKDNFLSDRIMFAGERLLHGSMLIIVSTAIRYALFSITGQYQDMVRMHIIVWLASAVLLCGVTIPVFNVGMIFATKGFRILNDVLSDRMFRHDDWDE